MRSSPVNVVRNGADVVLNRLPVVAIVMVEGLMIYLATSIAKLAFTQLDPLLAAWYRVGFVAILLFAWRRPLSRAKRKGLPRTRRDWGIVVTAGVSVMLMNTMFYLAISNMDMGIAVSIEFIGPLAVAVLTGHGWRERVGILLAACGVVLLAGISLANPAKQARFLVGLVAILIDGVMWGLYIVSGRQVAQRANPLDSLSLGLGIAWLLQSLFLAVPAVRGVASPKPGATWARGPFGSWKLLAVLFVVAFFASFLPYLIDQFIMRRASSARFSVIQSVNPVMAVLVGLLIGEVPTWGELAGVAMVIAAVIVTFSGDMRHAETE
ncbi:EamA family transporter [Bifidobacterium sp. ESL0763]|uniref:EamA family transporter n=1 Tax=Bifidobacterium sp. ESL0763 TaxID=2983227 RepID=UPI0023F7492F|nr:EamA family transporter [Bifidobacterium sp. ESL0763]MDF7663431.1 EamA family transporter [Bifidobacterium sp. ESL0763]